MATATAPKPKTEPEFKPVTFESKSRNLRLVVQAESPSHLVWDPSQGAMVNAKVVGRRIEFTDGRYVARTPQDVEWLRNHVNYRVLFGELGDSPMPPPDPTAETTQIVQATAEMDEATLTRILEDEIAGHNRDVVVFSAKMALQKIEEMRSSDPQG